MYISGGYDDANNALAELQNNKLPEVQRDVLEEIKDLFNTLLLDIMSSVKNRLDQSDSCDDVATELLDDIQRMFADVQVDLESGRSFATIFSTIEPVLKELVTAIEDMNKEIQDTKSDIASLEDDLAETKNELEETSQERDSLQDELNMTVDMLSEYQGRL